MSEVDNMSNRTEELNDGTEKADKPRGKCSGCAFEYQLGTARTGEYKGQLVIRKHNSRTGPGLCSGAQKPAGESECDPGYTRKNGHMEPCADVCSCGDPNGFTTSQSDERRASCPAHRNSTEEISDDGLNDVVAVAPGGVPVAAPVTISAVAEPDPFQSPGAASDIPESTLTVSGQPEPDRDRWGRYKIHGQAHTRVTTFAKIGANTKAIEAWNERNVIVGLTRREDLLMMAQGKQVKADRNELNLIAQQAKDAAGSKVAANIGTGYHSFTERVDAGLMTVDQVPERYRARVQQYVDVTRAAGLVMRREWIERTTAVTADQISAPLPVAGTLDRIVQLPDGSLCIADLKTGSDLSYGEMEIEVQLTLYAHGVNTHGLFDWNTKQWQDFDHRALPGITKLKVRTDIAIVIHLPADGDGCTLYVADIGRGWADAQKLGQLQGSLKTKNRFRTLTRDDLAPAPAPDPWERPEMQLGRELFLAADGRPRVAELYQFALDSGKYSDQELGLLASVGTKRLRDLNLV